MSDPKTTVADAVKYIRGLGDGLNSLAAGLENIDWGGPPPVKSIVSFVDDSTQLIQAADAETVHAVPVHRTGSTAQPVTAHAEVKDLDDILAGVDPAQFGAGAANDHVFIRLKAGAPGQTAVARPPRRGRANLLSASDMDLGDKPSATLEVTSSDVSVPPPPDTWWLIPGGNRSGKKWNIGVNTTGWNSSSVAQYVKDVGRQIDVVCAANHPGGHAVAWDDMQAQANFLNSSNFGALSKVMARGKTIGLLNIYTHPVSMPLAEIASGKHDDQFVQLGGNLRATVAKAGWEDWQLALRVNKEMGMNGYLNGPAQAHDYGQAMGHFLKGVRQGYGMTSRGRLRASFSPARSDPGGPLAEFCSFDDDGSCLYDTFSCSTHPANQMNADVENAPEANQIAAVNAWLAGEYRPGYSYLHKNPDYSVLALARKFKSPISLDEWSPRFESKMACFIGAAAIQAIYNMLVAHADEVAWDCVFNSNILTESDSVCKNWSKTSRRYKDLWRS